jgi:hypothetical protein
VPSGTHAGAVVDVDLAAARTRAADGSRFWRSARLRPDSATRESAGPPVGWPDVLRPIPVAVRGDAGDSAAFWAVARGVERDWGAPLFRPQPSARALEGGWPGIVVQVTPRISAAGFATISWDGATGEIAGALVEVRSRALLGDRHVVGHELLHAARIRARNGLALGCWGAAHAPAAGPTALSLEDVAYGRLLDAARRVARRTGSPFGLAGGGTVGGYHGADTAGRIQRGGYGGGLSARRSRPAVPGPPFPAFSTPPRRPLRQQRRPSGSRISAVMTMPSMRTTLAARAAQTLLLLAVAHPLRAQTATPTPRATATSASDSTRTDAIPLSLAEAVERGVRQGDEVRLSETQIEATDAQVAIARSAALPQLRAVGSYQQVLENARATIVGSVFGQNYTYNGNASLTQPSSRADASSPGCRRPRARVRPAASISTRRARSRRCSCSAPTSARWRRTSWWRSRSATCSSRTSA